MLLCNCCSGPRLTIERLHIFLSSAFLTSLAVTVNLSIPVCSKGTKQAIGTYCIRHEPTSQQCRPRRILCCCLDYWYNLRSWLNRLHRSHRRLRMSARWLLSEHVVPCPQAGRSSSLDEPKSYLHCGIQPQYLCSLIQSLHKALRSYRIYVLCWGDCGYLGHRLL